MQDIRILENQPDAVVFEGPNGEKYRLKLTQESLLSLKSALRGAKNPDPKVKPREIQARLREGLTAKAVAEELDLDIEDVQRYEGPILAERDFMLKRAQNVEVRTAEHKGEQNETFGEVITERIKSFMFSDSNWSVKKSETDAHWIVEVEYLSALSPVTASWEFDHRKLVLTPINELAENLSKQSDFIETPAPNLRVVPQPDNDSAFDSKAFEIKVSDAQQEELLEIDLESTIEPVELELSEAEEPSQTASAIEEARDDSKPLIEPPANLIFESAWEDTEPYIPEPSISQTNFPDSAPKIPIDEYERRRNIEERAIHQERAIVPEPGETEDLLAALRKRRSERDAKAKQFDDEDTQLIELMDQNDPDVFGSRNLETVEIPITQAREFPDTDEVERPSKNSKSKKGRTSVPSWDEILFGKNDNG